MSCAWRLRRRWCVLDLAATSPPGAAWLRPPGQHLLWSPWQASTRAGQAHPILSATARSRWWLARRPGSHRCAGCRREVRREQAAGLVGRRAGAGGIAWAIGIGICALHSRREFAPDDWSTRKPQLPRWPPQTEIGRSTLAPGSAPPPPRRPPAQAALPTRRHCRSRSVRTMWSVLAWPTRRGCGQ